MYGVGHGPAGSCNPHYDGDQSCVLQAMNNVGYYRVGNAVVPVACGKETRRGGIETAGVESRPSRLSTKNRVDYAPQAVCNKTGGKLKYSIDAHFASRSDAKANGKARRRG